MVSENFPLFFFTIAIAAASGALVGFFCRGRLLLQLLLGVIVSVTNFVVGAWVAGTLSNQISLDDPIGSLYWVGPFYLFFLLLPTLLSAIVVGWLRRRKIAYGKE